MKGVFPRDGILVFERVQQWTVEWVNCALSSGVNVDIPYLIQSKCKVVTCTKK